MVFEPQTEEQCEYILELARREGQTVRAAGVGHSPSDLACTSGYMLRTEKLDKIIEVSLRSSVIVFVCFYYFRSRHPSPIHRRSPDNPFLNPVPHFDHFMASGTTFSSSIDLSTFPTIKLSQLTDIWHSPLANSQVNTEKNYAVVQAGITLNALHAGLAAHNLAMINVGSISDQTLAGIVTTATHGTGMNYKVISTHVLSLVLLLADGSRIQCSRQERADLFAASLCGLGSTGLILQIKLEVGPAFRLKEVQESIPFVEVLDHLDTIANASEHVRMWWFPQADVIRVSSADRTQEVIHSLMPQSWLQLISDYYPQPKNPAGTWMWHSFLGFHIIQFLFYLGRFFPSLNPSISRWSAWLDQNKTVTVDDSWRVFNLDCKVRH